MSRKVVVVGGGPAAVISAATAKKHYPDVEVTLIRKFDPAVIPCGIPYIFSRLDSADKDIMGDAPLKSLGVNIVVDEVVDVDRENKVVITKSGAKYEYDKLILATGSVAVKPNIPGIDLKGIYVIEKNIEFLRMIREEVLKAKKIVIVGGGFIGVEIADDVIRLGDKEVSIVEMLPHCLQLAFDEEFCIAAEEELKKLGVKLYTNCLVTKFEGKDRVEKVILSTGEELPADLVIVSVGSKPNAELAKKIGLEIGKFGGIIVDEYMRTSDKDIFAVGDCVERKSFFTGAPTRTMLASISTAEARIAGLNLFDLKVTKLAKGTIGIFSTKVGNLTLGVAGLTESMAKAEGYDVVVGVAEAPNRHPAALEGAQKIKVKLIFSKESMTLIGGVVMGPESVGEIINMIGVMMQNQQTAVEIMFMQIGTHPLVTAAPTVYPVLLAAEDAIRKLEKAKS